MAEPFCASSPEAAAMSDGEFWEAIEAQRHGMTVEEMRARGFDPAAAWDDGPDDVTLLTGQMHPCPECGQVGPCAYDVEGRPMIHAIEGSTDD